jgi:glyoxylase-like metal-dependent hydrolase (beta-lactamase superfamily II)
VYTIDANRISARCRSAPDVETFEGAPGTPFRRVPRGGRAGSTITLVITGDVRILVDTAGPSERSVVMDLLAQHALSPEQIDYVVCTHGHTDHIGNNNLFPGTTFLVGHDRSVGDAFDELDYSDGPLEIAADVHVAWMPGHTSEDISLLVHTDHGVVAIVGDVFENGDALDESWVRYSRDPARQERSRTEILAVADFIVPGHGPIFTSAELRART